MNTYENIIVAHQFSHNNRESILKSKICGCFFCFEIFSPAEIKRWIDKHDKDIGQTALCPRCGVDSVLGDRDVVFDKLFLEKMHKHWF